MPNRPLPDWPAAMGEAMAAAYIGVSATKLRELVADGRVARVRLDGRRLYLRRDLNAFLDRLAGIAAPSPSEWQEA